MRLTAVYGLVISEPSLPSGSGYDSLVQSFGSRGALLATRSLPILAPPPLAPRIQSPLFFYRFQSFPCP